VIFGEIIHVLHKDLPRILQQSASIEAAVYRSFLAGRIVDRIKALAGVGGGGSFQIEQLDFHRFPQLRAKLLANS
jgi:hypothetical protein